MHNLGDDRELDHLSREAAGRYIPPGKPDWDALSAELDKVMPVTEKKRGPGAFWWLLPLLAGVVVLGYWFIPTNGKDNDATVTAVLNNSEKSRQKENSLSPNGAVIGEPASANVLPKETDKTNTDQKGSDHSALNSTFDHLPAVTLPPLKTGIQNKAIPSVTHSQTIQDNQSADDKGTPHSQKTNTQTATASLQTKPGARAEKAMEEVTTTTPSPDSTQHTSTRDTTAEPVAALQPPVKKSSILPARGRGFSIGLLGGVDESTVKFTYGNNAGYNLGLSLGYHFNDRWSVHTGAIYTQKNYKMAGQDFTAPKGTWVSYYKLETVEGYCRMWEIPLLARYTISKSAKNPVFLSTGLSSYFMTRENYDYLYYNSSGTLVHRNSAYNSTDTHVLSILHLSAGFEHRMGRSMSMIVEPYAKLPLGGVGFGSIHLSSFGLNFAVQYRQPSTRQNRIR